MSAVSSARRIRANPWSRLIPIMAILVVLGLASEIEARGRGGGMSRGRISRGGPAQAGSIRHDRMGGSYRSQDRARSSGVTRSDQDVQWRGHVRKTEDGYVARGVIVGEDGAAAGSIVRSGDNTRVRGVSTDGQHVTVGEADG